MGGNIGNVQRVDNDEEKKGDLKSVGKYILKKIGKENELVLYHGKLSFYSQNPAQLPIHYEYPLENPTMMLSVKLPLVCLTGPFEKIKGADVTARSIKKTQMSQSSKEIGPILIHNAISKFRDLSNVSIIRVIDFIATEHNYYLITEYCNGGSIRDYFQYLWSKEPPSATPSCVPEDTAKKLISQILWGINTLFLRKIVLRNLCLDNIHISAKEGNVKVKITDLFRSKYLENEFFTDNEEVLKFGKKEYLPPEIYQGKEYDDRIDIWAIGIITYKLLFGFDRCPFGECKNEAELKKLIISKSPVNFIAKDERGKEIVISEKAKEFISKALERNFKVRPNFIQLKDLK